MPFDENKVSILSIMRENSILVIFFAIFFLTVLYFSDSLPLMLFYLVTLVFVVAGSVLCWVQYRFWENNIENIVSVKDDMVFIKTLTKTHQFRVKDIRFGKIGTSIWVGDTSKKISFTRFNMGEKNFNIFLAQLNSVK